MAVTYTYPTSYEITAIDPILMAAQIQADPLIGPMGLFPTKYTDADRLIWDQRDSYSGLMQFRGLNNDAPRVKRLNAKRYSLEPGYYGEFNEVDEAEMTRRSTPGTSGVPIPVDDLVNECHEQLMVRQSNLMRWICSQLLVNGAFVVLDKDGAVGAVDSYKQQVYAAPVSWSTAATAHPLLDLRQIPVLGRGQSTNFGAGSEVWMTQVAFNAMIANQNANDLRGERLDAGRTVESLADVNIVLGRNNLPAIRIYDEGYLDTAGAFHTYIPDTVVVYVGRRYNGQSLGEFRMTKNVNAPGGKGVYDKVVERGIADNEAPPAKLEVHRGFNGGPVLFYPGAVFVIQI